MDGNKVRNKLRFINDVINLSQTVISSLKQEEIFHELSTSTSIGTSNNLGLESFFQKICQKEIKWLKPFKFLKINFSGLSHEDVSLFSDQLNFYKQTKKPEFRTTCNFNIYNQGYKTIDTIYKQIKRKFPDFKQLMKYV